ncbi:hypothetical protein K373_05965 [Streptomyces sp. DvalAA-21]|nr:hypothetical protein SACTE_2910 [Streptomyces sp. SirexAA-E]PZX31433.1 hypothetical protein K373_05965 [Streptomyces sp. DvalAA-21]RAJ28188.1 hypothetical protein K351_05793 [Streptomyces sp. DpondAA-E10]RAJ41903.1 hypothetical protein K352_05784 [Streptomyces sp. DpondAA-A50]SCD99935.1 hypothetical protein GA0115235_11064 [Streptomyces sp. DpondAA-F4a]SCL88243.1 hypothetical protein SAMN04883147_1028116 [Streptomyces sp. DpondAA-F4]
MPTQYPDRQGDVRRPPALMAPHVRSNTPPSATSSPRGPPKGGAKPVGMPSVGQQRSGRPAAMAPGALGSEWKTGLRRRPQRGPGGDKHICRRESHEVGGLPYGQAEAVAKQHHVRLPSGQRPMKSVYAAATDGTNYPHPQQLPGQSSGRRTLQRLPPQEGQVAESRSSDLASRRPTPDAQRTVSRVESAAAGAERNEVSGKHDLDCLVGHRRQHSCRRSRVWEATRRRCCAAKRLRMCDAVVSPCHVPLPSPTE